MNLLRFLLVHSLMFSMVLSPISWAQDCSPGEHWNGEMCKVDDSVAEANRDTLNCANLPEGERDQCHKNAAVQSLQESGLDAHKESVASSAIVAGLNMALGTYAIINLQPGKCDSNGAYSLMKVAAILNAVNEVGTHLWYKLGLKKLMKDYETLVDNPGAESSQEDKNYNAVEAQSQAFKFVAKKEKLFKTVSHVKGGVYITVAALYATAMIIAIVDLATENTPVAGVATSANNYCLPVGNPSGMGAGFSKILLMAAFALPSLISYNSGPQENLKQHELKFSYQNVNTKSSEFYLDKSTSSTESYFLYSEYQRLQQGEIKSVNIEQYQKVEVFFEKEENKGFDIASILKTIPAITRIIANNLISSAYAIDQNNFPATTNVQGKGMESVNFAGNPPTNPGIVTESAVTSSVTQGTTVGGIRGFLGSSAGRITIAGLLGTAAGVMASHAIKEGNKAKKRQEYMEGLVAHFSDNASKTIGVCTTYSRGNPNEPKCYCYNEDGGKNEQRARSKICQDRWSKFPSLNPTDYSDKEDTANTEPKFCFNSADRFDYKCSCAATGKCSSILSKIKFPKFAKDILGNVARDTNSMLKGDLSGASIDMKARQQEVARIRKIANQLKDEKGVGPQLTKIEKRMGPLLKEYPPSLMQAYAASSGLGSAPASTAGLPPALAAAVEEKLKEEGLSVEKSKLAYAKGGAAEVKAGGEDDFSFSFGDSAGGGAGGVKIEGAATDKFDYGNDIAINQQSDTDIFKILSFRYKKSGLRRIFGNEKQQAQHDEAATTDISQ